MHRWLPRVPVRPDRPGGGRRDKEVAAIAVGPTCLANIESVEVQERGRYNADGKYYCPVRARVKGGVKIKVTNVV
jgi:hypothetical protein